MLILFAFIVAATLAFGFDMLILLPAALLGCLLVVAIGLLTGSSLVAIASQAALLMFALQVGYGAGILLKFGWLISRSRKRMAKPEIVSHGTI